METVLNVLVLDEASLSVLREHVRALDAPAEVIDRAVLVATELGRNQLEYARHGRIAMRLVDRAASRGIELDAIDEGSGIVDLALALEAGPRATGSLGVGIGSVRRLSTELDMDVRLGEGSRFVARIFPSDAPRAREVGVYGRPLASERVSGDHAGFVRRGDTLLVGVCDGLGHGPAARVAADAAMAVFAERANDIPAAVLEACHRRIGGTRGVVMSVARLGATLELASIGNIEAQIASPRGTHRFGSTAGVVGGHPGASRTQAETSAFADDEVLLLMTDGIVSRASLDADPVLRRAHPAVIAQRMLERFARPGDDALVLVVR